MTNETEGSGSTPSEDRPPDPAAQPPTPEPSTPEPPAAPAPTPPDTGAIPGWGQQASVPTQPPAPPGPATAPDSGAIPGWGQPAAAPTPPSAPPPESGSGAIPGWGQSATPPPAAPTAGWVQPPPADAPTPPPAAAPPPPAATWAPQQPAAPGGWQPGQAPTTVAKSSGCLKFGLGITVLGCLGLIAVLLLALVLLSNILGFGLFGLFGSTGDGGGIDDPCPFLSDEQARQLFGGQADAIALSGLYEATVSMILDDRVLPDANDCWVTQGTRAYAARLALHQGGDASAVFDRERQNAEPQVEDQGGGITVTRDGYFGGDVPGLGDRAFCTGTTMAGLAGVVVQRGDRVLYVSVGQADPESPPVFEPGPDGAVIAPEQCAFAQEVARAILG